VARLAWTRLAELFSVVIIATKCLRIRTAGARRSALSAQAQSPLYQQAVAEAARMKGSKLTKAEKRMLRGAVSGNRGMGRFTREGPAQGGAIGQDDAGTRLQHAAPQLTDVLEKDEYVGDVLGSNGTGNVVVTKYPINPGQASLFPLGSAEAAKWTCWKCVSCEPYLMHEVSEFATDGSTGKVILAVDYNAANDTPTTKQQVEDMHSASCMPCEDIGLKLIPALLNRADPKYIRTGVKPAGTDIRLYDGGNLFVVAAGQAGNSKISELRIRYKFQLCLPTLLNPTGGLSDDATVAQFVTPGWPANTGGESLANNTPLVLLVATAVANGIGAVNTSGTIVPPAGDYRVTATLQLNASGSVMTNGLLFLNKNGAAIQRTVFNLAGGGTTGSEELTADWIVSMNGTDSVSITAQAVFGSGTVSAFGSIILQLV